MKMQKFINLNEKHILSHIEETSINDTILEYIDYIKSRAYIDDDISKEIDKIKKEHSKDLDFLEEHDMLDLILPENVKKIRKGSGKISY